MATVRRSPNHLQYPKRARTSESPPSGWLAALAAGLLSVGVILRPGFSAWLLAMWAAAVIAIVSAVAARILRLRPERRQQDPESPPPEENKPEENPEGPAAKTNRNGSSREWGFSFKIFRNTRDGN